MVTGAAGVRVVVVTHNSQGQLDTLLDSLPAALGGLAAEVVVVDNDSRDDTVALALARGGCRVVRAENRGYAAGVNAGVALAASATTPASAPLLVLNPDVRLAPGAVPALLRGLADPATGIAVPRLTAPDGTTSLSLRREPTVLRALGADRTGLPALAETVRHRAAYAVSHDDVEWATGAVMLLDPACYADLGGFDESFFMYSEETDFCLRARDRGWRTRYVHDAVAEHVGGGSGTSPDLYAVQVLNRIRLHRRRHTLAGSAAFLVLTTAREAVHALRGDAGSRRAVGALLRPATRPAQLPWRGPLLAVSGVG